MRKVIYSMMTTLDGFIERRSGPAFFPGPNTINLRLLETTTFGSGVVFLRYEVTR
jgi:hypothetical protein